MATLRNTFSRGDIDLPDRKFKEKLIQWLNAASEQLEQVSPGGSTSTGGSTIIVTGGTGEKVVVNMIGLTPGDLVNINAHGVVSRADFRTVYATHAVGFVSGGKAHCFTAWASGGLKLDGTGTGEIIYLGVLGQGRCQMPPRSSTGEDYYLQELGTRLAAETSGLVECKLNIASHHTRI